jgi:hypothetical protein
MRVKVFQMAKMAPGLLTVQDPDLGAKLSVLFTSAGALVYQWQYALLNWR